MIQDSRPSSPSTMYAGSYLLNALMFIIFLWSRNTGWATSSRTPLRMASGRRSLSQERLYWWELRGGARLRRLKRDLLAPGRRAALPIDGAVVLVVTTVGGTAWQIASCLVFGCTLVLVYVCSTLYHSLVRTRARHVLQIIDHSAIYLLIAGTYTPFALVSLRGRLGWLLFAIVWGLAIL